MNRRSFAALLPALAAGLPALAESQTGTPTSPVSAAAVETGVYPGFNPPEVFTGRSGHSFFHGMLPTEIGCEAHVSYLRRGRAARAGGEAQAFGDLAGAGGQGGTAPERRLHFLSPATWASRWRARCTGCATRAMRLRPISCGSGDGADRALNERLPLAEFWQCCWPKIAAGAFRSVREKARPRRDRPLGVGVGDGLRFAGFLIGAGLADVDAALEECAILDGNALRGDVAGERAFTADVDAIAGGDIAAYLAEHDNFARGRCWRRPGRCGPR